jgi:nucleotide-binding universal stress UspA family protein
MTAQQRILRVRDILAATDFSTQAAPALEAAAVLAQHFGARLHVVHVVTDKTQLVTSKAELESHTAETIEGVEVVRTVLVGQAAVEIVKYAERQKIDLVVLGTHRRSGLARVILGSVAEAVVRSAPCQVLTIGPRAQVTEEATLAVKALPQTPKSHCLICAKPSPETICDPCKAHIQGEAIERKRREEQSGRRGLTN